MSQLATVYTRAAQGLDAPLVSVQVHLSNGLPNFSIVGLPEMAVRESKERVRSAIINSQFEFFSKRITVSLSPADLPKSGGRYDLPIALAILLASQQLKTNTDLTTIECYGELALNGDIKKTGGLLSAVIAATKEKKIVLLPQANCQTVSLVAGAHLSGQSSLLNVVSWLMAEPVFDVIETQPLHEQNYQKNFAQVKGQYQAKRAFEIAACGGHHLLLMGTPGSGKTMLAERLPSILPPLTQTQALEKASIFSLANQHLATQKWYQRAFIAPHHSASAVALVGGGTIPKPGAISLAHFGVLFLDELPEFPRQVLESLRQPLETKTVHLSRAANQVNFPANFQLIAAMNACPCGYLGDSRCHCTQTQIKRYVSKISGPLLDRIDMVLDVKALTQKQLLNVDNRLESSEVIAARVQRGRRLQFDRQGCINAELSSDAIEKQCCLDEAKKQLVAKAIDEFGLSARAYFKILRLARSIADLAGSQFVDINHLSEAIGYRRLQL